MAPQKTNATRAPGPASDYAELGLAPIPIAKRGKRPTQVGWQKGDPPNPAAVDRWIAEGGNVGLRMGEQPDGRLVVALDEDEPGALAAAEAELGALPETLTSRTGKGGQHRLFEWPSDAGPLPKNRVRALQGIDVRSQGGQIVVAPSVHPNGTAYGWEVVADLAMLPAAWREALTAKTTAAPNTAATLATPSARVAAVAGIMSPIYAQGGRHELVRGIGGWLARFELGRWNDSEIQALVAMLPSDQVPARIKQALEAAAQAREGAVTSGWGVVVERVGTEIAARLEVAARSEWWVRALARWLPANDTEPDEQPHILVHRTDGARSLFLWTPECGYEPVAASALRLRLGETGRSFLLSVDGKRASAERIAETYGQTVGSVAFDFARSRSEYEPANDRVIVGYPKRAPAPAHDARVDAWLRALAGPAYSQLAAWIAACRQDRIDRLAAALVLVGSADIGKTLFARACAGLWGETEPPRADLLVSRFNADLKRCPIVLDEEATLIGSGQLSTKAFRDLIQRTERSLEPKGRERFQQLGALRLIVPCNGLGDLRFNDVSGPAVVDAVSDRLAIVDASDREGACRAPLASLRAPGGWLVDLPRIVAHFAWLADTAALPDERFLGSTGRTAAAQAVLSSHVARYAEVFEGLAAFLDGDRKGPWSVHDRQLCIDPSATFGDLMRPLPRREVNAALAPFKIGQARPGGRNEGRKVVTVLDHARLAAAVGLDAGALRDALGG